MKYPNAFRIGNIHAYWQKTEWISAEKICIFNASFDFSQVSKKKCMFIQGRKAVAQFSNFFIRREFSCEVLAQYLYISSTGYPSNFNSVIEAKSLQVGDLQIFLKVLG